MDLRPRGALGEALAHRGYREGSKMTLSGHSCSSTAMAENCGLSPLAITAQNDRNAGQSRRALHSRKHAVRSRPQKAGRMSQVGGLTNAVICI